MIVIDNALKFSGLAGATPARCRSIAGTTSSAIRRSPTPSSTALFTMLMPPPRRRRRWASRCATALLRWRKVHVRLRLLCRECGPLPGARADRDRSAQQLRHVQPARRRARRDAVEFSVLAGVPLCRTRPHGGKRRRPKASNVPGCALAIEDVFRRPPYLSAGL
jgi:hypothetical protein